MTEKCNIYRVSPSGTLKSIIDDSVIVDEEVMRDIEAQLYNYLREEEYRKGEHFFTSQTIVDPKTTLDKE